MLRYQTSDVSTHRIDLASDQPRQKDRLLESGDDDGAWMLSMNKSMFKVVPSLEAH